MSDVAVTVSEEPVYVTIDDNTPVVSITDESTSVTISLDANPASVVVAEEVNEVTVLLNGGRPNPRITSTDLTDLLLVLTGAITIDQLDPALRSSVEKIDSLESTLALTVDQVNGNVTSIGLLVDKTDTDSSYMYSQFQITEDELVLINQQVTANDAGLVSHTGEFHVSSSEITAIVSDIDTVAAGLVTAESGIQINADNISLFSLVTDGLSDDFDVLSSEVDAQALALQAVEDEAIIQYALIQVNSDSITEQVNTIDGINNELLLVEDTLTDHSATLAVQSSSIDGQGAILTATREMLNNEWGVNITRDVNGDVMAAGFSLIQYPMWSGSSITYQVEDIVWSGGTSWECILAHVSDDTNYPQTGSTYWVELPDGESSLFTVEADKFVVQTSDGVGGTPFSVVDGLVTITGRLVIQNAADVRTDLNVEDGATAGADWNTNITNIPPTVVNTFYQSTAPASGMVEGDYWIDSDTNESYRYSGTSWVSVQDAGITSALVAAGTAQATADGKVRTFAQTAAPTGMVSSDVGDIWMDTDDANKLYRWDGSSWVVYAQDSADWAKVFGTGRPADYATYGATPTEATVIAMANNWAYTGTTEIDGGNIRADTITAANIAADAITSSELAAGSVYAGHIVAGAITATEISVGTITADRLVIGGITVDRLASNAVSNNVLVNQGAAITPSASVLTKLLQLPVLNSVNGGQIAISGTIFGKAAPTDVQCDVTLGLYRDNTSTLLKKFVYLYNMLDTGGMLFSLAFSEPAVYGAHTYYLYVTIGGSSSSTFELGHMSAVNYMR